MNWRRIYRRQEVPRPVGDVFRFYRDPRNLEGITPRWLNFRIVRESDRVIRVGSLIEYRLRLNGIPITWVSRIVEYEEGRLFADEQIAGPYKAWYHRHLFTEGSGGTVIEDFVDYELGFGLLGDLVHAVAVRGQLTRIFDHRARRIQEVFSSRDGRGDRNVIAERMPVMPGADLDLREA